MFGASEDFAGGVVSATLANNDNEQDVFGCRAVRQSTGSVLIRTGRNVPVGRARIWVEVYSSSQLTVKSVQHLSPTDYLVLTYALGVDDDPVALTETPTDYTFAFGISALPDG